MPSIRQLVRPLAAPLRGWAESTEPWLKARLVSQSGFKWQAQRPRRSWMNSVLRRQSQVTAATDEARSCGLPLHPDSPKNWDSLSLVAEVSSRHGPAAHVLEGGATLYSPPLPALYRLGFRNLTGIDLVFDRPTRRGPIRYQRGDITRTPFHDRSFDAIITLSVIEHGVDVEAYLREAFRLLRPGGTLATSTDYWESEIDTKGKQAFGVPIKIFTRDDLQRIFELADAIGFQRTAFDLGCKERVVHWQPYDLRYTFVSFSLHKAQ